MTRRTRLKFIAAISVALLAGAAAPETNQDFARTEADWRAQREGRLKEPDGWLSVAGLFWLHDGIMKVGSDSQSDIVLPASAPRRLGALQTAGQLVTFLPEKSANAGSVTSGVTIDGKPAGKMTLKPDTTNHPDIVQAGPITLTIIKRGNKTGVRMRDSNAATRRSFTGCKWFPVSRTWLVKAKWVPYPTPKKIRITNILGMTDDEPSPGYAEFTMNGKTLRLEPTDDDGDLSFMFKDATSGKTTYAPGRFLDVDKPKDGVIVLDFNQAYNPPCAFTAYATCPLPPKQNTLDIAVEAGEKKYGDPPKVKPTVKLTISPAGDRVKPTLVLASRSPRRAELLTAAGIPFIVRAADIDETPQPGEVPDKYVLRMAEAKAVAVPLADSEIVLAADTTVALGTMILGKPVDPADATRMLTALAGRRHDVLTGICLRRREGQPALAVASTAVWFGPMNTREIDEYAASGEPLDKAGAYAIQGVASRWVERIDGSYANVVGLPVALVWKLLGQAGFDL